MGNELFFSKKSQPPPEYQMVRPLDTTGNQNTGFSGKSQNSLTAFSACITETVNIWLVGK